VSKSARPDDRGGRIPLFATEAELRRAKGLGQERVIARIQARHEAMDTAGGQAAASPQPTRPVATPPAAGPSSGLGGRLSHPDYPVREGTTDRPDRPTDATADEIGPPFGMSAPGGRDAPHPTVRFELR